MIIKLKILVITLFSVISCSQKQQLNVEKQYLIMINKIGYDTNIENLGHYLLQANDHQINSLKKSNKEYNVNSIINEVIVHYKAIPVLDYPIKFWKDSCNKKKLVFPQDLEKLSTKDSLELSKVYGDLTNSSNYSMIELKTLQSVKYKLLIGFAEIENKDICLINWTHRISDTTAILGNKFSLKD